MRYIITAEKPEGYTETTSLYCRELALNVFHYLKYVQQCKTVTIRTEE